MEPKRIDIKVGYLCNNNCLFCIIDKRKRNLSRGISEIFNEITNAKRNGFEKVVFTGGEVTIRKDYFKIIKFAKKIGFKIIHIESNGRRFENQEFVKKSIECGVNHFTVSLPGFSPETYQKLTRTSRECFDQVIMGLKNLKKYTDNVGLNCTITKLNYKELNKLIKICDEIGIKSINFPFVNPEGNAWINKEEIVPKISEATEYLRDSFKVLNSKKIRFSTEMIPLCFMQGFEMNVVEMWKKQMSVSALEYKDNDFKNSRKKGKIKPKSCKKCVLNDKCEGIMQKYSLIYGLEELRPILEDEKRYFTYNGKM